MTETATSAAPPTSASPSPVIPAGETFCKRFRKNAKSNEFDNVAPSDLDKLKAELQIFAQLAPAKLEDDYQVLIDAVNGQPVDPSAALKNIQAYAVKECNVTIDGN